MNKLSKLFGNNLKKIRKSRNISQRDFAEKADLSETTILGLEKGQIAIQFETLEKLCLALDIPPSALLADEDSAQELAVQKIQHAIKGLSEEKLKIVYNLISELKNI